MRTNYFRLQPASSSFSIKVIASLIAFFFPATASAPAGEHAVKKAGLNLFLGDPELEKILRQTDKKGLSEKIRVLSSFQQSLSSGRLKQKCSYVLARSLSKGGSQSELKTALSLFEESSNFAPLYERSNWHIAECAGKLGEESTVQRSLAGLLQKSGSLSAKAKISYALAQSLLRSGSAAEALEEFKNTIKYDPDSNFARGAVYYLGQNAFDNNKSEEGLKLWREYLKKSPDGRFARDIVKALKSKSELQPTADDHMLFAEFYYRNGECSKALSEWKAAESDDSIWFKQANCLLRLKKTEEGKQLLLDGLLKHPGEAETAAAVKTIARLGSRAEAISIWKTALKSCPNLADMALYNLAIRAEGEEALSYYSEIAEKYPNSDFAPEASWWLVWNKIKTGKIEAALPELKKFAVNYNKARCASRFSYWIGKLEERQHRKEAAAAAYKNTAASFGHDYYGWRARARLQVLAGAPDRGWSSALHKNLSVYSRFASGGGWRWPEPPQLISYNDIASCAGSSLAYLAELRQWDECLELLPDGRLPQLRSLCLAKLDLANEAINTEARVLKGSPNGSQSWQLAYPLLHSDIVKNESSAKSVDPLLAQALIREESRYNIYAVSASNALGLMQLLPGTAFGVAKRLHLPINTAEDIHRPENNIKLGIDYLSYTLKRFDGNAMLAVASYNGGPNAVAKWVKSGSLSDPDIFVEDIPYQETRDYVRKVFGSFWNYSAIYSENK